MLSLHGDGFCTLLQTTASPILGVMQYSTMSADPSRIQKITMLWYGLKEAHGIISSLV